MILGNAYDEDEINRIKKENSFCVVNKEDKRYKRSILLALDTKQAKIIRDYLIKQIDEDSRNDVGIGIIIHTGLFA